MTDLSKLQDTLKCGNCRNSLKQSSKVNITELKQDIVVVRCDDCQKLFEKYPQFTTGFAICTCDGGAKELDLEMAKNEEPAKKVEEVKKVAVVKEEVPKKTIKF
mgnify:CR=1 FL=1